MLTLNKHKILIKVIVLIILICGFLIPISNAVVKPTSEFYVNDYANLLNSETKNYIIDVNKRLHESTGAQIVVVTIDSLNGQSLELYATQLFREFGIGDKRENNGVLLLLALKERKFRIEVGYGLEGALNDAKTGRIQDEYIIPYLKNNNWDDGIRNGFNAVLKEVSKEYNVNVGGEKVKGKQDYEDIITLLPFATLIISTILSISYQKRRNKKKKIILIAGLYYIAILLIHVSIGVPPVLLGFCGIFHGICMLSIFRNSRGGSGGYGGFGSFGGGSGFSGGGFSGGGSSGGGGSSRDF